MRVLIVHTAYLQKGGEDSVLASESELLKKEHEVEVLLFKNEELKKHNPLSLIPKLFYNRSSAKELDKKISSFKPDIIHIHNLFYWASASILFTAKKRGIPVVMTLHNFRLICSGALLLRDSQVCELCVQKKLPLAGIKHACFQNSRFKTAQLTAIVGIHKYLKSWENKVDRYLVFSPFLKERFLNSSLDLKESQISIKPNFVEDFGFSPKAARENFFLFIGRLSPEKGINTAVNAAIKSGFRLEIIGGGDLEGMVKEAAKKHENITYHGFQDRAFILEKLKKTKALLFPSIWYEGMPITILESFSTGTPIIISNQKNVGDFVEEGLNGLHFNSGEPDSLCATIERFNQEAQESFYEEARKSYLKKYSPEVNLKMLSHIYQSLIVSA